MVKVPVSAEVATQASEKISLQVQTVEERIQDALETKGDEEDVALRAIDQALKRLDERVVVFSEEIIVDALEKSNSNVNK